MRMFALSAAMYEYAAEQPITDAIGACAMTADGTKAFSAHVAAMAVCETARDKN